MKIAKSKSFAAITALTTSMATVSLPAAAIETQTKQDLTAISAIAVATVAAGPIGFLAGAFGGSWLAKQVADADSYEVAASELASTQFELASAQSELDRLNRDLDAAKSEQARFAKMALDQLQLEMLFKTGDAKLTPNGQDRLELLATFLKKNPDLTIQIEGFADPRGDAKANLALSKARAQQVADALAKVGVRPSRMTVVAHGESQSKAIQGDVDAYAMERLVRIELNRAESGRRVADVTLSK